MFESSRNLSLGHLPFYNANSFAPPPFKSSSHSALKSIPMTPGAERLPQHEGLYLNKNLNQEATRPSREGPCLGININYWAVIQRRRSPAECLPPLPIPGQRAPSAHLTDSRPILDLYPIHSYLPLVIQNTIFVKSRPQQ